jgi:uncharacterized membrane protein YgaE (UPF0421/DUF939 family)
MLIIENLDTLLQGVEKIKEKIDNIKQISSNINLSSNEKQWLNILISDFKKNLKNIEKAINFYDVADKYKQQQLINLTLDLYNDVNKILEVIS